MQPEYYDILLLYCPRQSVNQFDRIILRWQIGKIMLSDVFRCAFPHKGGHPVESPSAIHIGSKNRVFVLGPIHFFGRPAFKGKSK